jgi:hypothetical protein
MLPLFFDKKTQINNLMEINRLERFIKVIPKIQE